MVTEFSVQLWNNVLIREGLPEDYRPYNKKAPKGRGKIITGEYDSNKLIQMDGFSLETAGETENLSLLGSLFRVRPEGSGPDQFESNETDAE